jgi:hypothetical protein
MINDDEPGGVKKRRRECHFDFFSITNSLGSTSFSVFDFNVSSPTLQKAVSIAGKRYVKAQP